ncbi:MAG: hypothetical protein AB1861_31475 [Cyanobacteriota bacterium]
MKAMYRYKPTVAIAATFSYLIRRFKTTKLLVAHHQLIRVVIIRNGWRKSCISIEEIVFLVELWQVTDLLFGSIVYLS